MGECGTRTLFASTSEGGLNTTSKMSVFDSAALGAAACDAADTDTTPATTAAVIAKLVNMDFRIVPPWRAGQAGCRRRWLLVGHALSAWLDPGEEDVGRPVLGWRRRTARASPRSLPGREP